MSAPLLLDVHGYRVCVEGPASEGWFRTEYGRFETTTHAGSPHLRVVPRSLDEPPIRPKGSRHGLAFEDDGGDQSLVYDPALDPSHVLPWVESMLDWPDKTLAHASGVTNGREAFVFFAGPKTGKTTTVLSLAREGFGFLGDDFVIVGNGRAYPYPKTVHLYDYNLADDPELCARVLPRGIPWTAIMRMRTRARRGLVPRLPSRGLRYAVEVALARMVVAAPIERLGERAHVGAAAPLREAVWMVRSSGSEWTRQTIDARELAENVVNATFHERAAHIGRFALEAALQGREGRIDARIAHAREILRTSLEKARCIAVGIPRKTPPLEVAREMRKLVEA